MRYNINKMANEAIKTVKPSYTPTGASFGRSNGGSIGKSSSRPLTSRSLPLKKKLPESISSIRNKSQRGAQMKKWGKGVSSVRNSAVRRMGKVKLGSRFGSSLGGK